MNFATIETRDKELKAFHAEVIAKPKPPPKDPGTPPTLNLADSEVLALLRSAKNRDSFERLWRGDISEYDEDDSRADLGFCSKVAFYTQDPAKIDRLYRASALNRDKWDERRGASTYGVKTIEKALADLTETYQAPRSVPKNENPKTPPLIKKTQHSSITPAWPQEVMTGAAGIFARTYSNYLETPECFLYMDYLTLLGHIISDQMTLESEIIPQTRLYTVNLGESADTRKTTSVNVTEKFFSDVVDPSEINPVWGVGSAEGLAKAFGKNPRVILILDELKALVQKMRIDASVLLPCVNTLFELNRFHSLTKSHDIKIDDAQLCLLAASTLETYRNMFTPQFLDIGFLNRLFIVVGDSQRKFPIPKPIPKAEKDALMGSLRDVLRFVGEIAANGRYAMPIAPQAQAIFDEWYFSHEESVFSKRLDTYGHRLMPLLAVNEMRKTITQEIAQNTVALLNYQLEARKYADPIDADNAIAKLEEKIRRLVSNGPLKKRELERHGKKSRVGNWFWNTAIKNLAEEIQYDHKSKVYSKLED